MEKETVNLEGLMYVLHGLADVQTGERREYHVPLLLRHEKEMILKLWVNKLLHLLMVSPDVLKDGTSVLHSQLVTAERDVNVLFINQSRGFFALLQQVYDLRELLELQFEEVMDVMVSGIEYAVTHEYELDQSLLAVFGRDNGISISRMMGGMGHVMTRHPAERLANLIDPETGLVL